MFLEEENENVCSNKWPGPKPGSEIETRNIKNYVSKLRPIPILTISLHSAAELILFPYSYSATEHPTNWKEIVSIAILYSNFDT